MLAAALFLHVTLAVPPATVSPALLSYAVAETAALWAPYGVIVEVASPCGTTAADATRLTVAVVVVTHQPSGATSGWRGPLAAIPFDGGGSPAPTITLYLADVLPFIRRVRVLGAEEWRWPVAMRDQIVGRVVGRVIAHEIGHYLLRSPDHARRGLMRSAHTADDLVSPSRRGFDLSADEASRMASTFASAERADHR